MLNLQVGLKILLKNTKDQYLFILKSSTAYEHLRGVDMWDIPGGRINDASLSLHENLQREVHEELGVELDCADTQLLAAQDIFFEGGHVIRLTYLKRVGDTFAPTLSFEHNEYKWMTREEILAQEHLDKYLRTLLTSPDPRLAP